MCVTCGCALDGTGEPWDNHGDERNITVENVADAARAVGITPEQATANLLPSLALANIIPIEPAVVTDPEAEAVLKSITVPNNPKRFVLGVAYSPDTVDGHGEFMSAPELERIAWEYCRKHRTIGFYHADGTLGHAEVVESYIHRGDDWETSDIHGNLQVVKKGSWVLGALLDEPGFAQVTSQKADGWSMDGLMGRRKSLRPA
jgi:hypothetical protein